MQTINEVKAHCRFVGGKHVSHTTIGLREKRESNNGYLLIDSFEGALSDFADETVVDFYDTKIKAMHEVVDRVHYLANCHNDEFAIDEIPKFPSDKEVMTALLWNGKLKYVAGDGGKYTWQIVENPRR